MGALYVRLPQPAHEALLELAVQEYRRPGDQAALILMDGLRRAGLLTREPENDSRQEAASATR